MCALLCAQVEQYGASQSPKLSIVGYYHANKRAKTHTLGLVASRIASKVVANCPGAAICLVRAHPLAVAGRYARR